LAGTGRASAPCIGDVAHPPKARKSASAAIILRIVFTPEKERMYQSVLLLYFIKAYAKNPSG
jgi:hypothetical protein